MKKKILIGAIPLCSGKYLYFTVQTYVRQRIDEIPFT